MDKYDKLERIKTLLDKGILSESEYEQEKVKILSEAERASPPQKTTTDEVPDDRPLGMDLNTYCLIMHLSLLLAYVGGVIAIVLWILNKDKYPQINQHGKAVVNWFITLAIASVSIPLIMMVLASLHISLAFLGVLLALALAISVIVCAAMGALSAQKGELFKYPIPFTFVS